MPVIRLDDVVPESFKGGATYRTLVGNPNGSTPIRMGVQTSPPGYATPTHSHPYMETVTVLEGAGEAWISGSDAIIALAPGTTCVFPANTSHWFRAIGDTPLVTLGVHASPHRIVDVQGKE